MKLHYEQSDQPERDVTVYTIYCRVCWRFTKISMSNQLRDAMHALADDSDILPPLEQLWSRIHDLEGDTACWMVNLVGASGDRSQGV
jgi:hypothetical protein